MTKLRTMTTTNLPVPTTFGKLIRPTGLDDFLTQTWSVVKGDMVWFGPLPHPEEEMTPAFRSRILSQTAPGIIPSTVHRYGIGRGRLADESIDRDIEDETHHIKHESVFYNTKLFFQAIWVAVKGLIKAIQEVQNYTTIQMTGRSIAGLYLPGDNDSVYRRLVTVEVVEQNQPSWNFAYQEQVNPILMLEELTGSLAPVKPNGPHKVIIAVPI